MKPEIDLGSATWKVVETHANERIANLRLSNDSEGNSEIATAVIRGQIKALKALLALAKAPANGADEGSQPY